MATTRRLLDAYWFPGFRPLAMVRGLFGDPKARIVSLQRRRKKRSAASVANPSGAFTTARYAGYATCRAATLASTWKSKCAGSTAAGARP